MESKTLKENCVFCKILAGELPASIIYEDDLVCAFLDIQPVNPGHVLVIPKEHYVSLGDVPEELGARLFQVGQKVAQAIRKSNLQCEGINLMLADGEEAGQEVWHCHLHVFPRFKNDGFGLKHAPTYFELPERDELDEVAEAIKQSLA